MNLKNNINNTLLRELNEITKSWQYLVAEHENLTNIFAEYVKKVDEHRALWNEKELKLNQKIDKFEKDIHATKRYFDDEKTKHREFEKKSSRNLAKVRVLLDYLLANERYNISKEGFKQISSLYEQLGFAETDTSECLTSSFVSSSLVSSDCDFIDDRFSYVRFKAPSRVSSGSSSSSSKVSACRKSLKPLNARFSLARTSANEYEIRVLSVTENPSHLLATDDATDNRISEGSSEIFCGTENNAQRNSMNYLCPVLASMNERAHKFVSKMCFKFPACTVCTYTVKVNGGLCCEDCGMILHVQCKRDEQLPCVPIKNHGRTIASKDLCDFAPNTVPLVPAVVVYCVAEIERRGLKEIGIYREQGSHTEFVLLKRKLMANKGCPLLIKFETKVIASVLKDFLQQLNEPLIPKIDRKTLVRALELGSDEKLQTFYQILPQLPRIHLDTLSYVISHLQRVARSAECCMPIQNLAKVLGLTIVGPNCGGDDSEKEFAETKASIGVLQELLSLPSEYWINNLTKSSQTQHVISINSAEITSPPSSSKKKKYFS